MACVFPFTYLGVTYDECQYYFGQPACATQVDEDGVAMDYGYCGPNCPINGKKNLACSQTSFQIIKFIA